MIMISGTNLLPTHDIFKIKTYQTNVRYSNQLFLIEYLKYKKGNKNTNDVSLNPLFLIGRTIFITNQKTIIVLVEAQGGATELPFLNAIKPTL